MKHSTPPSGTLGFILESWAHTNVTDSSNSGFIYCSTIRVQFDCTNIEQNVKILFMQCYGRKLTEQCNLLHTDPVLPHIMAGTSPQV